MTNSRHAYDFYTALSKSSVDSTSANGRYEISKYSESFILGDVLSKLELSSSDTLLDIGCGSGLICMPLCNLCQHVYALDNPGAIERLRRFYVPSNCTLYEGEWLSSDLALPQVTKIVIYSVLHCLENEEQLFRFIDKALSFLAKDREGILMLGDLPNVDKKRRFLSKERGKSCDTAFSNEKKYATGKDAGIIEEIASKHHTWHGLSFTDELIYKIVQKYRLKGYDVYVLPQMKQLPFGCTREDILIKS